MISTPEDMDAIIRLLCAPDWEADKQAGITQGSKEADCM